MRIRKYCEHIALSIALAGGMGIFAVSAQAHSRADVSNAQQQLKQDGYYNGSIDGVDGPMTRSAIRHYQRDNNLAVNGRLDDATCNKLGLTTSGEANRSVENGSSVNNEPVETNAQFQGHLKRAQRALKDQGFYSGPVDGVMGPRVETAIRKYQESNGLNVTGHLDQITMNHLGISQ
jgi:peptidoglycan hydrolase-like protein with peptidoglycan-binding domain